MHEVPVDSRILKERAKDPYFIANSVLCWEPAFSILMVGVLLNIYDYPTDPLPYV